jgi:large subunit ribosomal protein L7/L12
LLFNDRGVVFDTNLIHSGYQGNFVEQARIWAPERDTGGPHCWRGLYSVTGRKITCVIPEFNGLEYGFTGEISSDGRSMKLKRTGNRDRKGLSGTFTFHGISGWPPAGVPSPSQAPAAVIRTAAPAPAPSVLAPAPVAAPVAGLSSGGTSTNGVNAGQELFDVVLEAHGNKQIRVIKAVRVVTPLGLREAKSLVDGVPSVVLRQVDQETAEGARALLDQAGGRVTLRSSPQLPAAPNVPGPSCPGRISPHRHGGSGAHYPGGSTRARKSRISAAISGPLSSSAK